ncbi:MAG: hypothetical protein JO327_06335 [Nitrososphaeraceae archaeon]|nr:hypothetical protein [Nitrososphaeraceae archaeon]
MEIATSKFKDTGTNRVTYRVDDNFSSLVVVWVSSDFTSQFFLEYLGFADAIEMGIVKLPELQAQYQKHQGNEDNNHL